LPFADAYGRALEATLARLIEEYEKRFLRARERPSPLDEATAREALRALRDAVPEHLRRDDAVPEDFLVFVPHAETFVNDLARIELFEERPLLEPADDRATVRDLAAVVPDDATASPRGPHA